MEELLLKFDSLSKRVPIYEAELNRGIIDIERLAYEAVEKGKVIVNTSKERLAEIDNLVEEALMNPENSSPEIREYIMQCVVSFHPRIEEMVNQLEELIQTPPKKSIHKIKDYNDSEEEEEEEEDNE